MSAKAPMMSAATGLREPLRAKSDTAIAAGDERGEEEQGPYRCGAEALGERLANAKRPAPARDAGRAPVAEDQGGEALEAAAGDLVLVVGPDVDGQPGAAEAGQRRRRW